MLSWRRDLGAIGLVAGMALGAGNALAAWEIVAKLERDNNGTAGPSELAGSSRTNKSTTVQANFAGGFPNETVPVGWPPAGSEIGGSARVDLSSGAMRGFAHAVAGGVLTQHSMAFYAKLTDTIILDVQSGTQAYDDWLLGKLFITVHGNAHGVAAASNRASSDLHYSLSVNNTRASAATSSDCVSYPGYCEGQWDVLSIDSPARQRVSAGGNGVSISTDVLVPISKNISIVSQLDGEARAWSDSVKGVGMADALAANTAWITLSLPQGVSLRSSQSGVFLTSPIPESGSAAMLVAGLAGLAGLGRRRRR